MILRASKSQAAVSQVVDVDVGVFEEITVFATKLAENLGSFGWS